MGQSELLRRVMDELEQMGLKHLRDITGVLRISAEHIDHGYVSGWAAQIGAAEIWSELLRQCGPDAPPRTK